MNAKIVLMFCGLFAFLACFGFLGNKANANSQKAELKPAAKTASKKILVVYYSRTGNTKRVAEDIAAKLKADIEEIRDKKKRDGIIGYMAAGRDASIEKLAEIDETKNNPANYDIIIIGTPVWAWNITPAARTYLTKHKDILKQVAFFTTAGGTAPDKIVPKIEKVLGRKVIGFTGFVGGELKAESKTVYEEKINKFIALFQ